MGTQWYSSFARAHVKNSRVLQKTLTVFFYLTLAFSFLNLSPQFVWSETSFLSLPAFDLEGLNQVTPIRVGDELRFKIHGVPEQGKKDGIQIEAGEGVDLHNEGWELSVASENEIAAVPLKPGKIILPSLILKNSKGTSFGRTNPVQLDIQSGIKEDDPEPDKPADLEPPVGLKFPYWVVFALSVMGFGVIVILLFFAYRIWKKRQSKVSQTIEVQLPEDEIALQSLANLVSQGLYQKGQFKSHYFKISEIIKTYVGARYRFDAPESTTREMITFLEEKKAVNDRAIDQLESVFEKLDRVKFTDHIPEEDESVQLINEARQFVQATRLPRPNTGVTNRAF
jgi:hypothetical protein